MAKEEAHLATAHLAALEAQGMAKEKVHSKAAHFGSAGGSRRSKGEGSLGSSALGNADGSRGPALGKRQKGPGAQQQDQLWHS